MPEETVAVTLRIPLAFVQEVDRIAKREHRSRARQVQRFVEQALRADGGAGVRSGLNP